MKVFVVDWKSGRLVGSRMVVTITTSSDAQSSHRSLKVLDLFNFSRPVKSPQKYSNLFLEVLECDQ